jgi:cyclohexadieny/prephenate dehydrogenase
VSAAFRRLAVLGLGLLGGSVALAARRRGVAARVVGATRRADVRQQALSMGAVDEMADFRAAAQGADLVVLATPVYAMPDLVREVAPALGEGALLTDVGSVKSVLADTLPGLLPPGVAYVGAHPMAGSHRRGMEHARADLFEGATCVVMQTASPGPRERVVEFWRALGARVVLRDPARHDAEVAWMSHVPHALAFAFARAVAHAPEDAFEVRGPGFRDFTRIAHSDPELWADILIGNRKALTSPLQAVSRELDALVRALEAEDAETLERLLTEGRAALFLGEAAGARRSGCGEEPEPPASERSDGARESRRRHS